MTHAEFMKDYQSGILYEKICQSDDEVPADGHPALWTLFTYHVNLISPHDYRTIGTLIK